MAMGRAQGYPDMGSAGTSKYTPQLYAKKLLVKFYSACVLADISNRDYEGEITKEGDKVLIRTVPDVQVFDYVKGMDLNTVRQTPESPNIELVIDKAKGYSVGLDDIDEKQNDINAMGVWAEDGSQQLALSIDRSILNSPDFYSSGPSSYNIGTTAGKISSGYNMGTTGSAVALTRTNVLDYIADADAILTEQDVPLTDRWMVIPVWVSNLLNKSDLKSAMFTGDSGNKVLRNGKKGMISNFNLYESNCLTGVSDTYSCFNIPFGHRSALTFATQLIKNRTLELQNTFGKALEGLQVYGWEVIKPEAMGVLYARKG